MTTKFFYLDKHIDIEWWWEISKASKMPPILLDHLHISSVPERSPQYGCEVEYDDGRLILITNGIRNVMKDSEGISFPVTFLKHIYEIIPQIYCLPNIRDDHKIQWSKKITLVIREKRSPN